MAAKPSFQSFRSKIAHEYAASGSVWRPCGLCHPQIFIVGGSGSVDGDYDLLDESESEKAYEVEKHRAKCKALIVLRLTYQKFKQTTTSQLFRTFCLTSPLEFWSNIDSWRKWFRRWELWPSWWIGINKVLRDGEAQSEVQSTNGSTPYMQKVRANYN